jgi:two-component system, OmpR family, phosphate regulon sensor histidine kinase PhoR
MNTGDVLALMLVAVVTVLSVRLADQRRRLRDQSFEQGALQRDLARTAEQHRTSQQHTATLADTAFDALLVLDYERRIVMINQAGRELFSASPQVIGQTLMALTRDHELDVLAGQALQGEPILESQLEIRDRSFRVRITVESRSIILALQDVTELLRLARARRDMVANFSHDLRTPISSIRLLMDTLIENFGRSAKRDKRLVGKIAGEMDSLEHMTQELIDLSMIESGKAIIRMVPVGFATIVEEALDVMATQIEQKKLDVDNQIPGDLRVLADPEQTRRAITNVIHNAVKFTPSGGQIRFTAVPHDQMATAGIKDTGPGIPPQDRGRIFERFYQVDASRSGQAGGSGLGLSIAKHIIEAQGGKIWAEAGVPNGACICFTIPLADEHA